MKLLILGGTLFLGRYIAETAIKKGHKVTLFNRGKTNIHLFPKVEKLIGDRDGGLNVLKKRRWDAVIDVNGYLPRLVKNSAHLLRNSVNNYIFISSVAVYADFSVANQNENSPLGKISNPNIEKINEETYGPLKGLCEQIVKKEFPNRNLIIRPGYIVGPHDYSGRFIYWLNRTLQGGEMLTPGEQNMPLQFIDVRDLAAFILHLTEIKKKGTYNITGPATPFTWGELLDVCKSLYNVDTHFIWVSESFLNEYDVSTHEIPLWHGSGTLGFMQINCNKAINAGLRFCSLHKTIIDTLAFCPKSNQLKAGLTLQREKELLTAWLRKNFTEAG